jgi:hypothetical protein
MSMLHKKHIAIFAVVLALGYLGVANAASIPGLPNNGTNPNTWNVTVVIWAALGGILAILIAIFFVIRKKQ